jgi:archaemetzincin
VSEQDVSGDFPVDRSRRAWLQATSCALLSGLLPTGCDSSPPRFGKMASKAGVPRAVVPTVASLSADSHRPNAPLPPIGTEVAFNAQDRAFVADRDDFEPKRKPRPGDWLARFHETGITFDEYVAMRPTGVIGDRKVIVLQPLGSFTKEQLTGLLLLADYAEAFFYQPVRVGRVTALPKRGQRLRREAGRTWLQRHTGTILEALETSMLSPDAICVLGITMDDLYPEESWNYVFGEATLEKRVGVYSLARYQARFWGEPETNDSRRLLTLRSFKVLAHEAGHMFSLPHCRRYECLMNGSNSLDEMDRAPVEPCPVCLKMLEYNLRFDVRARYRRLALVFERAGLVEQRNWVEARLRRIS